MAEERTVQDILNSAPGLNEQVSEDANATSSETPLPGVPEDPGSLNFELPDMPQTPVYVPPVVPPPEPTQDNAVAKVMDELKALQESTAETKTATEQAAKLQDLEVRVREKYGSLDPAIAQEFSDVLDAARKAILPEIEISQGKNEIFLKSEIQRLNNEIAQLKTARDESANIPEQDAKAANSEYYNTLKDTMPRFAEMASHPTFKWLLGQPVSPLDPNRTWDLAIGDLILRRQTGDLKNFVSNFFEKYETEKATVPTLSPDTGQGDNSADAVKAESLLRQHNAGEINLSTDDRKKLTELVRSEALKAQNNRRV